MSVYSSPIKRSPILLNEGHHAVSVLSFNDDLAGGMFDTKAHPPQLALQVPLCISGVEEQAKLCAARQADVGCDATDRSGKEQPAPLLTVNVLQGGHRKGDEEEESGHYMGR